MIERLILSNFRNYQSQDIKFGGKINILTGENGQGKTNILEAIYFLSFLRSFRTRSIDDLKKIGTSGFYLGAELLAEKWNRFAEIRSFDKKFLSIDKVPVKKSSDFIGLVKPIVFSHEDIKFITGTAKTRRRNLDIFISLLSKDYFSDLQNYSLALKSRNFVLRLAEKDFKAIESYEPVLASFGERILFERYKIISLLEEKADKIIKEVKGKGFSLKIKYISRIKFEDSNRDYILRQMVHERQKDIKKTYSGVGPHLDDVELFLNNRSLRAFGSLGEYRIAALCLKLSEAEIITEKDSQASIALVDDISGELDAKTKDAFYKTIDRFSQVFLTFTNVQKESYFKKSTNYFVKEGIVHC